MKQLISLILFFSLLAIMGCTQYHAKGSGTGTVTGGGKISLLDNGRSWKGGVIGGAIGAVARATLADISLRASQEVLKNGKPVRYRTDDGCGAYRADPLSYNERTKCRKIRERVWENGTLIKDETREVCKGEKVKSRH